MAYRIKVTLKEIEPPIWRRLRVPGYITFAQLHAVIQAAFGWHGYHLYRFELPGMVVTDDAPDYTTAELWGEGVERLDPGTTLISPLLDAHQRCLYEYDFGDSWEHEVVVERRLKEDRRYAVPVCLAGARHRPPEDVGGVGGYEQFLETIMHLDDPERKESLEWAQKDTGGRLFDPEHFHLNEVNQRLEHVLTDTPELAHDLLTAGDGLVGVLRMGWFGPHPYIEASGQRYSWDRLGNLLSMLDDELPISIRVGQAKRNKR